MSLHRRRRTLALQWPNVLWLTAVWVLLWGELSVGNVVAGLAVAVTVTVLLPLPVVPFHMKLRPLALTHLVARFLVDLVVASLQVAVLALRLSHTPHGAVVGVKLRNPSDLFLTLTAELSTLVPGTVVVEAHRITGMLYLHVLDVQSYGGIDKAKQDVLDLEERVLRAMASDEDLARAGLAPRQAGLTLRRKGHA